MNTPSLSNPSPLAGRVLVVDDSAVVRKTIAELLEGDPEIEVMAMLPPRGTRPAGAFAPCRITG